MGKVLLELIDADPMEDAQQVKLALQVLANCFCGADMESLGPSTSLTSLNSNETSTKKSKPVLSFHESEHKIENVMQKAWDAAQENNALMTLIHYVQIDEPFTDADAIHVVACRALNGLARSEKIRQILSKLPLIADNELASLTRGPVLQDRASEHADFVKEARQLIRRVHQTDFDGAAEDLTYEKMVKAKVIKQTKIDFEQTGLQQLIHDYLMQTGFEQSAQMLQIEAGLEPAFTAATPKSLVKPRRLAGLENKEPMKSIFESPNSPTDDTLKSVPSLPFSDELTTRSEASPKCSTPAKPSRKSLSQKTKQKNRGTPVENDLKWKVVSKFGAPSTPANQSVPNRRFSHNKSSLLAQQSLPFSNRHMENAISMTEKQVPLKPHKALTDIVTEYFRNQHAHCEQPVVTCPPFSFYYPHRCPKPRDLFRAPINIVDRYFHSQSMPYRHSHTMFNRANRNFAFSHYCPVDLFDMEGETLTACAFSYDDSFIHLGTYSGDVHWMSLVTGRSESSTSCHNTFITSVQHSKDGTLLLTSSVYVPPLSALWRTGDTQDVLHTFADDMDMSFGYTSNDKIIGTQMYTANIYDTNTGELINTLYNAEAANRYQGLLRNKACFNHTDTLALNDGILWDVRTNGRNEIVHKFDKFSNEYCGKFHPNGNEVIISGSVWDIRTNGLLKHVVALDACDYFFNNTGDIIFSVTAKEQPVRDDQFFSAYESNFRVIDSFDYHVVTTVDTKRDIAGFAVDHADRHICTIEKSRTSEEPSICRIYEIGKPVEFATGEDGNEDDDDDNNDDDDDDVDGIFPSSNGTFDSDNSSASTDSSDDDQEDSISDDTEDGIQEMLEDLAQQPGFEDYQSDEEDEGPLDEEDGEGPDPDDDSEYDSDFNPNSDEEDV
ncbi:unnamed protein product [Bursaphelenchus xylophilus]|uniref:(pine wood nematode) hypothetical protein n=1 Tax=Bursaphelenchus xylophilus TaxID=6326 RepID=A0A1I7SES7_BURXY|nr:unnamed protein product [Bursaphelenchus xylophilus]CAG9118772.1 unnamed protein product [Bursaphelenchus xylophilus]